jgi:hypothetical protein
MALHVLRANSRSESVALTMPRMGLKSDGRAEYGNGLWLGPLHQIIGFVRSGKSGTAAWGERKLKSRAVSAFVT